MADDPAAEHPARDGRPAGGLVPAELRAPDRASAVALQRSPTAACSSTSMYSNSPLCAPARFAMMSGQRNSRIGAYDNAAEFAASIPTFAHYLRAAGYQTCLAGKMHFVGPDQLHGFEERLTTDIYPADFGWTPNWDDAEGRFDWWFHNMDSVLNAGIAEATNQLDYDDEVGFRAVRKLRDLARARRRATLVADRVVHPSARSVRHAQRVLGPLRPRRRSIFPASRRCRRRQLDPHSRRLRNVSAMDAVPRSPTSTSATLGTPITRRSPTSTTGSAPRSTASRRAAWPTTPSSSSRPTMATCSASVASGTR